MGKNRLEEVFRDPTLETPPADHFVVRHQWGGFCVTREVATTILTAISGHGPARMLRVETLSGSVVFIRTDAIEGAAFIAGDGAVPERQAAA